MIHGVFTLTGFLQESFFDQAIDEGGGGCLLEHDQLGEFFTFYGIVRSEPFGEAFSYLVVGEAEEGKACGLPLEVGPSDEGQEVGGWGEGESADTDMAGVGQFGTVHVFVGHYAQTEGAEFIQAHGVALTELSGHGSDEVIEGGTYLTTAENGAFGSLLE